MALIIAGERSGVGKTTVTLAILAFLSRLSDKVQSFKTGPDYIDPMFHTFATNRPCRNLDPVLTSPAYVQQCFAQNSQDAEYSLVEGVMGLFDGIPFQGIPDFASTAQVARLLNVPVLLVLDCRRLSGSIGAIAHGYCTFDPRVKIAGVILNQVGSERHLKLLQDALEPLHLPIFGVLYRQEAIAIPDRHLGLVPTEELGKIKGIFDQLATLAQNNFAWEKLLPMLEVKQEALSQESQSLQPHSPGRFLDLIPPKFGELGEPKKCRIAVGRDRAFNFYYQDNLDILTQLGAELVPWSPLNDTNLPPNIQGLYLGGGFPEVFAQQLAANIPAKQAVKAAIENGLPTYAECGGLMYLCDQLIDFAGQAWDMVGVLPTQTIMSPRLTLGYRQGTALNDTPLLKTGETVWGHEFHRSQLSELSPHPLYHLRGYRQDSKPKPEGWFQFQLHASYLHLHWGTNLAIPQRFLSLCKLK
jgi:cobyrinic acid a,c-diamide synthase